MFNSRAVLIPLKDLNISSGQLLFITAMQMGKPIVITDSNPTHTYLTKENAFILKNDIECWRKAIETIDNDNACYSAMSRANRLRAESDFSVKSLGLKIGSIIAEDN